MTSQAVLNAMNEFKADLGAVQQGVKQLLLDYDDLQAAIAAEDAPGPTVYSQRDSRWANDKLGTSASTIGGYGCLITSIASCLTDAGMRLNPAELNTWLNEHGGYANANLFVFNSIDKLNALKFYTIIECANIPAPMAQLDQFVAEGWFVVVKVDFNPATMAVEEHWVRYLGAGQMVDPWWGDVATIVPRYRGANAAQAILRAAIYKRVST